MRTFQDDSGREWDAAVYEESYGTQRLVFSVRGTRELRSHELEFTSHFEAQQWLVNQDEAVLRERLDRAPPWEPGGTWREQGSE